MSSVLKYLANNLLQKFWKFLIVNEGKKTHIKIKKKLPFVTYALGWQVRQRENEKGGSNPVQSVTINVL